ncbi:MAG: 1-deoxy-D-xylulose-5-phosphate reductoisomerase [Luminiphilus sp.]|nr:1-deoxy-D-xylulose-5-phosphate reductoisomerase [Luminiphilus sp.]
MKQVVVLGATGSIGLSTLDVLNRHTDRFSLHTITANRSVKKMLELVLAYEPVQAVMACPDAAEQLASQLPSQSPTRVLGGEQALIEAASAPEVDVVMAAIVGFAGLRPTLAAAEHGKRLLLANKEALVSAGSVFMEATRAGGATLLPIDSEHNAMFQCIPANSQGRPQSAGVEKILLTASGGPFRGRSRSELVAVTPEQACAHPNWSMGRKISVDSATLLNKGLELAEACWLFECTPDDIDVVVHPQSIIHSLVRYHDGSVLAQLGNPDMRTPIAYGLSWPERIDAGVSPLDLVSVAKLDFEAPDLDAFPCLRLAQEAITLPGGMCVLNAANEVAVAAFLGGELGFTGIDNVIAHTLERVSSGEPENLAAVEALDSRARASAQERIQQLKRDTGGV